MSLIIHVFWKKSSMTHTVSTLSVWLCITDWFFFTTSTLAVDAHKVLATRDRRMWTGLSSESVFHRHIAVPDQKRVQTCPKMSKSRWRWEKDRKGTICGEKQQESQIGSGDIARAARTQNEAIRSCCFFWSESSASSRLQQPHVFTKTECKVKLLFIIWII